MTVSPAARLGGSAGGSGLAECPLCLLHFPASALNHHVQIDHKDGGGGSGGGGGGGGGGGSGSGGGEGGEGGGCCGSRGAFSRPPWWPNHRLTPGVSRTLGLSRWPNPPPQPYSIARAALSCLLIDGSHNMDCPPNDGPNHLGL